MSWHSRFALLGLLGLFWAGPGIASQQVSSGPFQASVVELYTSEGCNSCPPSDAFLSRLGKSKEGQLLVPLAFHVNYWDYIGWKDRFARAEYTQRQRELAAINKQNAIYTPEFVVDGVGVRGGQGIIDKILYAQQQKSLADISLTLSEVQEDSFVAEVVVSDLRYSGEDQPELYVAIYENGLVSSVDAGENRGKTLHHDYVVRYLSAPRMAVAGKSYRFSIPLGADWNYAGLGVATMVRLRNSAKTLQAVKIDMLNDAGPDE